MGKVSFITTKKRHVVIVKQPALHIVRDKSGKVTSRKQIQYNSKYDTIDLEEQRKFDKNVQPDKLYIKNGIVHIDEDDIHLLDFFRKTNQNQANWDGSTPTIFRELDVKSEALYELSKYEAFDEANQNVMKADDNLIRAIVIWFLQPHLLKSKTVAQLKGILRAKIESNKSKKPDQEGNFITDLNKFVKDDDNEHKLLVALALDYNILTNLSKEMAWSDTKEVIFKSPQSEDLIRSFSYWLKNDEEGRIVAKSIATKVKATKTKSEKK